MSEKGPYMNAGTNPVCEQKRFDCNKCLDGRCVLLTDTTFKRKCPFYKTVAEEVKNGRS